MSSPTPPAHTPGPWRVGQETEACHPEDGYALGPAIEVVLVNGNDQSGRILVECDARSVTDEGRANARLIASAPDLLAALKGLVEDVEEWWKDHECDTTGDYGEYNVYDYEPKFVVRAREAQAALAKAAGGGR